MSLKSNIAANYASWLYTTVIGIALVPLYLKDMGSEAYGLVGFFAMLQAWFNLLDLGLTPTIARESARYHGGAMSALAYRRLYRSLSLVFVCIAVIGGGALYVLADAVVHHWLDIGSLQPSEVLAAVQIMAVCVALRWIGGLYRGVVTGAERLVWLSGFNAFFATLRFVGVLVSMWVWGYTPTVFFLHQLTVAALEVIGLLLMCHRLLPRDVSATTPIGWSIRPIRPLLRFSLTVALTSSVWVLVTQTDKLVLSGILSLAEYGHFTLAVLVASSVTLVSAPISSAVLPRMTRHFAEGNDAGLLHVYRTATQLVGVIALPVTLVLAVFAKQVLLAWTGDAQVAEQAAPVLTLYVLGNGILVLAAFPYYLQFAKGDLKLHIIGQLLFVVLLIPALVGATMRWGMLGAGYAWLIANGAYFVVWVPLLHRRFYAGLHVQWLLRDLGPIIGLSAGGIVAAQFLLNPGTGGTATLGTIIGVGLALLALAAAGSSWVRARIRWQWRARIARAA